MVVRRSNVIPTVTVFGFYMMLLLFSTSYFMQEVSSGTMIDQISTLR